MRKLILILICLFLSTPTYGYPAVVSRIIDGDTVVFTSGEHVRLAGIDAPEHDQLYGAEAKIAAEVLLAGQIIDVRSVGQDRYHRTIAWLYINQDNVNYLMIANGYAWHYTKYDHSQELSQAEHTAQINHLGLWEDSNPIPPWVWRHSHAKP